MSSRMKMAPRALVTKASMRASPPMRSRTARVCSAHSRPCSKCAWSIAERTSRAEAEAITSSWRPASAAHTA
ncbi:hypothetical protein [Cystobacter fuscus]|uniref:hypothetical protein n=1 Tax=Cystobacter fuscus TaxID=43 RepID=UPI001E592A2C|nr:hypothetical protein [Cystobacter fuscus]